MTNSLDFRVESLADQLRTACVLEAAARKPGNVHPGASFSDLTFADMLRAADVSAPILAAATPHAIGETILSAVRATRSAVGTNANLGMLLLLAPLAALPPDEFHPEAMSRLLDGIDLSQTALIYAAIREAHAGGLQADTDQDIARPPTVTIVAAMRLAQDRDLIARQYATGFADVFGFGRQAFLNRTRRTDDWETAVIGLQLDLLSRAGDSLIARKCGAQTSAECRERAGRVLAAGWPDDAAGLAELKSFDDWLRADGRRRNPGATADLIAAVLLICLREGSWTPPGQIVLRGDARQ